MQLYANLDTAEAQSAIPVETDNQQPEPALQQVCGALIILYMCRIYYCPRNIIN